MRKNQNNPYTENNNRLADEIAAIQVMGTYKFYKLDFSGWAERIEGKEDRGNYWKSFIEQHPEFFRLDSSQEKTSSVWRRNYFQICSLHPE